MPVMDTSFTVGYLKAAAGAPLATSGLLDERRVKRLRLVSITTVDELLGAIRADPEAVATFIDMDNFAGLQADAARYSSQAIFEMAETLEAAPPALGAEPPKGMEIESVASLETFDRYAGEIGDTPQLADGLRVDLRPLFGPIRNQEKRGTCVGHACAAVAEGLWAVKHGSHVSLSPQYVFYNSKQGDGKPQTDGTWAEFAMPTLVNPGVCEERFWPYEGDDRPDDITHGQPPPEADQDASNYKCTASEALNPRSSAAITQVLDSGRPVEISIPVYRSWRTDAAAFATGVIPMPLPLSDLVGGHAMCVAGYGFDNDITGGWFLLLRNSWGTGWGKQSAIEPGYGAIPFIYIDQYGWEAYSASM